MYIGAVVTAVSAALLVIFCTASRLTVGELQCREKYWYFDRKCLWADDFSSVETDGGQQITAHSIDSSSPADVISPAITGGDQQLTARTYDSWSTAESLMPDSIHTINEITSANQTEDAANSRKGCCHSNKKQILLSNITQYYQRPKYNQNTDSASPDKFQNISIKSFPKNFHQSSTVCDLPLGNIFATHNSIVRKCHKNLDHKLIEYYVPQYPQASLICTCNIHSSHSLKHQPYYYCNEINMHRSFSDTPFATLLDSRFLDSLDSYSFCPLGSNSSCPLGSKSSCPVDSTLPAHLAVTIPVH